MSNFLSEMRPELVSEWSDKTCRLLRIRLHTVQTKLFGGRALVATNGKQVLRLVQAGKIVRSAQAQEL